MRQFLQRVLVCLAMVILPMAIDADDFQVTNANFEDWSGAAFNGEPQPKGWNASNVEQVGMKFNFAHKETGHNGGYCMMVQDQSVGAMGITETSPGYFSIGKPWAYLPSITEINKATAGTSGGQSWSHRPDTMSVWIRRTGDYTDKEDFYLLFYAWVKEAKGTSYKGKNTQCTTHSETNEESDIRQLMNGNECSTTVPGEQVCEGMWRERKTYGNWTNIRVPIYYINDNVPKYMNMIFSASNYPNFRANDGLYEGNSLYVDDIELIYSSKIDMLKVGGKTWKGFDPNSTDVQVFAVPEGTTVVPDVEAFRGVGTLTNARGESHDFPGRKLSGSEITITNGTIGGSPTVITVKSEDGKSTTTYRIKFEAAKSSNSKLANIFYTYTDKDDVQHRQAIATFSPNTYNYKVELPYGTKGVPTIDVEKQEDEQTYSISQAATINDKASVVVIAANGTAKSTYNVTYEVGKLADNTLIGINVNGEPIKGFSPSQTTYRVSLPTNTTDIPTVEAVSAYPEGEQTIVHKAPSIIDGGTYTLTVTTPGNSTEKVYKLNFKLEASSYSYLADLKVGNYIADFSPTKTTYYVNLPMGTTELPEITWEAGDEFQTITKTDLPAGAVDGTVRITVKAGNGDQTVYKVVFSTEKSAISYLLGIQIDGVEIPGFDKDSLTYKYRLDAGTTTLPTITWTQGDQYQNVVPTYGGVNGKTRLTVTAGDGSVRVYQITFSVETFEDNTLKSLSVEGYDLTNSKGENVEFDPETNEYWVKLPQGTTGNHPAVTYVLKDKKLQTANERDFSGLTGDYKITVRPQSGSSRTYIIHFNVETSDNNKLEMIYLNGDSLKCVSGGDTIYFDPEVQDYTYNLPEGISKIPAVTVKKGDDTQRVLSVLEGKRQIITVTSESGVKRVYTITFIVRAAESAYLSMIYLDNAPLPGFAEKTLDYRVQLTGETCPAITVAKGKNKEGQEAAQQVTITAPYGEGEATIDVKSTTGGNVYRIVFYKAVAASVQLENIAVNEIAIPGFKKDSTVYTGTYSKTLPTITYTKHDEAQTVDLRWKEDVAWLYVGDTLGNKNSYSIAFTHEYSGETALQAILIGGTPMTEYKPEIKDYTIDLPAGSTYPEVGYEVKDDAQVVLFGQVGDGKYAISVTAENGTTATYTVTFKILPYTDATLAGLEVEGYSISYNPTTNEYSGLVIEEGAELPTITPKMKAGQSVIIYNVSDSEQKVMVMAEDGTENIYTIKYTRVTSSNTSLKNILIDGKQQFVFDSAVHHYEVVLPRDAEVVPHVQPVALLDNQTVSTYFSRPDGTTVIEVEAQNGNKGQYTVAFPREKSDITTLLSLAIDDKPCDVSVTEYNFQIPFSQTEPYKIVYKAREGQLIRFIEAPISETTQIIVTAEKGTDYQRIYNIRYQKTEPTKVNEVKKVYYQYEDAEGTLVENQQLVPTAGDNFVDLPYGAKKFNVTQVDTAYKEQTILLYDGGIRRGAKIIAVSNRTGVEDVVYNIIPKMPEFESQGKLQSLKFLGNNVPNFRPNVYHYMINVETPPTENDFAGTVAYDGKNVSFGSFDAKKKQVNITVEGGETYYVCWYYYEDGNPFDFSPTWVKAKYNGYKPNANWTVPGDCADKHEWGVSFFTFNYKTGNEVMNSGNGVLLQSVHGSSLASSVPGMMTTGNMSLTLKSSGNSSSYITESAAKGIKFRNTPDSLALVRTEVASDAIPSWSVRLRMSDGTALASEAKISGDYSKMNVATYEHVAIPYPANPVVRFTATFNAAHTENTGDLEKGLGGTLYTSALRLTDIHFVYNSDLTEVKVNGNSTTKSGKTFTYTLGAGEELYGLPNLKFTGAVHDQMQTIEWLNDGEWIDGELKAKVTNYGENSEDTTIYMVVIKRAPVEDLTYNVAYGTYPTTTKGDSVFVNLPYGTKILPNLNITPNSIHQKFNVSKKGNAVSVVVTNEKNESITTVYVFRETKTNDASLEALQPATGSWSDVDDVNHIYTIEAEEMPILEYETKKDNGKTLGQKVDITYSKNGAVIKVTAGDGVTTNTYTINRVDPAVTTSGQIEDFTTGINKWNGLGFVNDVDIYDTTEVKPTEIISFTRKDSKDSVIYIQAPTKMEWQVYGTTNHTYTIHYPAKSLANDTLAAILVEGVPYAGYDVDEKEFDIEADTAVVVELIKQQDAQTITTTQQLIEGGIEYTADVTAEDGVSVRQYIIRVIKPRSTNANLAGILLDSVMLAGFDPMQNNYGIILPLPEDGVKRAQPKMPNVSYIVGQEGQTVEVVPGVLNGSETYLYVTSESGAKNTYTVKIESQKSACVDLTGITVNGKSVDQFEPGRHFYSTSLKTNDIAVDWTADDRFLKVTSIIDTLHKEIHGTDTIVNEVRYTLHVQAENDKTADYEITLYIENQSNDAQLANITLDGKDFVDFERTLNEDLTFDGGDNNYDINLPAGTTEAPEVSAQLKMEGQAVAMEHKINPLTNMSDSILLHVTAADNKTTNTYTLHFAIPLSTNANLSMIYVGEEPIDTCLKEQGDAFAPDIYFYQVKLPVGVHKMPEVVGLKGEAGQTLAEPIRDEAKNQVTLKVQAENKSYSTTYVVSFQFTPSDVDTLAMIYEDGKELRYFNGKDSVGFDPYEKYFQLSLPVETTAFPDLSWLEGDEWQTISMDTVEYTASTMIRQIHVTSESKRTRTYTVAYTIEKSSVDTLNMILVDQIGVDGFNAYKSDYYITLSAAYANELGDQMPSVEWITGDEYQTVTLTQVKEDSLMEKSLEYKAVITVIAATGSTRIYTVHFPVELSTDTTLNMINVSGKPLTTFDAERFNYMLEIAKEASVPVVSVVKKEDAQTYEIRVMEDTVQIIVWAEDVRYSATYTLTFERLKSALTTLRDIILYDEDGNKFPSSEFPYRPEVDDYVVNLQYDREKSLIDQLPDMEFVYYDNEQSADTTIYYVDNGDIRVKITVTAANGSDEQDYTITFHFVKPADAMLASLMVNGEEIEGFKPGKNEYIYSYPYGTDPADYFGIEAVTYVLSDSLAADSIYMEDGVIYVLVTAQDGRTSNTYFIMQETAEDGDNALAWITIAGDTIPGFDPEITFYTYYLLLTDGAPSLDAAARSENADVEKGRVIVGDTCKIIVTAANGDERYYYIHFAISSVNPGDEATANDVILKRVPGAMQLLAATIRSGVTIALYDRNGMRLFYGKVPVANPNDTEVLMSAENLEYLNNVDKMRSCLLIDVMPNQPYFYAFFLNDKKHITSGKIMILP